MVIHKGLPGTMPIVHYIFGPVLTSPVVFQVPAQDHLGSLPIQQPVLAAEEELQDLYIDR